MLVWAVWCYPDTCLELLKVIWSWAVFPDAGYFLKFAGGAFSWLSRRQKTVALSSTEAEYMSLSDCSRQVAWIKMLLEEIGYKLGPLPIC